jgi:diguanylate cyclase (GGDEF)-like protein
VLLNVVVRSLRPDQAVVMVRRGAPDGDVRSSRLVVASVTPEDSIPLGTELPMHEGELGFVVQTQLVVNRQDLVSEITDSRIKVGKESMAGFEADLIAPMVFDQETLGVIALSRPRRTSGDAKAALRLIAQTGAQALHNAVAYSRMKVTAEMDGLTAIYNKRHLTQTLSELIYRAACVAYDRRDRQSGSAKQVSTLSVFLFDIDHFKNYNDVNGHVAGDKLLQELARLVQASVRKEDVFGRFGGEEFLLIMPNTNAAQAYAAANKIRSVIAGHRFPFSERQPLGAVSVSGGVAEYPYDGLDATKLLRAADAALYEAKRLGRNRVAAAKRDGDGVVDGAEQPVETRVAAALSGRMEPS